MMILSWSTYSRPAAYVHALHTWQLPHTPAAIAVQGEIAIHFCAIYTYIVHMREIYMPTD